MRFTLILTLAFFTTISYVRVEAGETELTSDQARVEKGVAWFTAQAIGVEGKGWTDTAAYFDRLPARARDKVRPPVWSLSRSSAGLCIRFSTDSGSIRVAWKVTNKRLAMPHMPATGVSGVDLYVRHKGNWRWLAVGQPGAQSNNARLVSGLGKAKRDYLLYLPLYNGVESLELGVDAGSKLWKRSFDGEQAKPIVFWGTSITQGGCASRPGMVHTAILGRELNRPVINLGFSGNGRLEAEVATLMAELDAAVFVIDCLPNVTADTVKAKIKPVVSILRKAHPDTPILLVEDRTYTNAFLKESSKQRNLTSRAALKKAYGEMKNAGVEGLYYLDGENLLGEDGEDTVDGSHPTDLGFLRQAEAFHSVLKPILNTANKVR